MAMTCAHCRDIETEFGRKTARRELRRYRRRGPVSSTRLLLDAIRREVGDARSLLDIGGGIGVVHHELLRRAAVRTVVQVEASSAYMEAAREEAGRRGQTDRVAFVHGDFVELAPGLDPADIVTLDRVVCCYPHMERLVGAAAGHARRLIGLVYPRGAWWLRLGFPLPNLYFRLRRSAFRVYFHPPDRIDQVLRRQHFLLRHRARTAVWEIAVYGRSA